MLRFDMTKRDLLKIFTTNAAIARFFGITAQAVGQWSDDEAVPELRQCQLALRRPDLFCEVTHESAD